MQDKKSEIIKNWNEVIQEMVEKTKEQVKDRKKAIAVHIPCSPAKHLLQKDLERKSREFSRWSRELLLELDEFERKAENSTLRVKSDLLYKFNMLKQYVENINILLSASIELVELERKHGGIQTTNNKNNNTT